MPRGIPGSGPNAMPRTAPPPVAKRRRRAKKIGTQPNLRIQQQGRLVTLAGNRGDMTPQQVGTLIREEIADCEQIINEATERKAAWEGLVRAGAAR